MNAHAATSLTILPALGRLDALLARAAGITNERVSTSSDESNEAIIDGVRRLLDRSPGEPAFPQCEPLSPFPSNGNRFETIADVCDLNDFDLDVVVLALAPELDRRYEHLYAWLQQDANESRPTVNLALDLFCCDATARIEQRARFGAESPLLRSRAIELSSNGTLLSRVIRLDEQLVRYLTGDDGLDARLDGFAGITQPDDRQLSAGFAPETLNALSRLKRPLPSPARLSFEGPNRAGSRDAAGTIASEANRSLLTVDCRAMLKQGADAANLFPIIFREARFRNAVLLLTGVDHLDDEATARDRLDANLASSCGITILASDKPLRAGKRPLGIVSVPFPMPPAAVRQSLWNDRLAEVGVHIEGATIDALADSFRLDAEAMDDIALTLANSRSMTGVAPDRNEIFRVARAHSGRDLAGYATRIAPSHSWDDLILDGETLEQLRDVQNRVLHRRRVLAEWGFARLLPRGRGISVLFSGPSGTGKTMAAEVIASELGLDLYRIDLATVVSKYIGETEKNLEAIFNAAADANGILFFDEADAIFGRRSEVKDAHDRYANLEISYLLQKMEQFDGVAILATNLRDHLDDAFLRRLQIVVEFRLPDEELRERMWRAFFPNEVPLDRAIDFAELARQFRLSGGNIKNIAVAAAYGAAANGGVVDGAHVLHAARREHQKIGRRLHLSEFDETATGSRGVAAMFQDLDTTLENLLSGAAFPPALGPVEISFKKPDKTVSFNGATISLFLYSAKENRQLRDPMPIVEFNGGTFRRRRPPMRVDCDYIVTAWHTGLSLDARVAAEHQLLATALTRLSGFPTVPAPMLAGAMAGQPFPVPLWVAQEEESKSLGEFWSSLGISPCASFHLMATIALDPGVATVEGPPVTTLNRSLDDDLDRSTAGESMFTFGGHVRNAAGDAIPNALVTLDGGIQTHTDADGAFVFPRVAAGTHTLVITSGALSANRSIAIPPDPTALPPPTLTDFDFVL